MLKKEYSLILLDHWQWHTWKLKSTQAATGTRGDAALFCTTSTVSAQCKAKKQSQIIIGKA